MSMSQDFPVLVAVCRLLVDNIPVQIPRVTVLGRLLQEPIPATYDTATVVAELAKLLPDELEAVVNGETDAIPVTEQTVALLVYLFNTLLGYFFNARQEGQSWV